MRFREAAPALLLTAALAAGCVETEPVEPVDIDALTSSEYITRVFPGGASYAEVIDDNTEGYDSIVRALPSVAATEGQGPRNNDAPEVSVDPIRLRIQESISGDSVHFNNDGIYDIVQVEIPDVPEGRRAYLAFVAMSNDSDDLISVSWPLEDGEPGRYAQITTSGGYEPIDGIILFTGVTDAVRQP